MKYDKEELQALLKTGKTLKEIGFLYGVSRQRIYQVLEYLGIPTVEKTRKNQKINWSVEDKWAWKTLTNKFPLLPKAEKLELLKALELPKKCPVLAIELDYYSGKGVRADNSPSLDRIDSSKGYEKDNILVISWRANRIKNDGSWEEHFKIASFYKNLQNNL